MKPRTIVEGEAQQHYEITDLEKRSLEGEIVVQPLTLLLRNHLARYHHGVGSARTVKELTELHQQAHDEVTS